MGLTWAHLILGVIAGLLVAICCFKDDDQQGSQRQLNQNSLHVFGAGVTAYVESNPLIILTYLLRFIVRAIMFVLGFVMIIGGNTIKKDYNEGCKHSGRVSGICCELFRILTKPGT